MMRLRRRDEIAHYRTSWLTGPLRGEFRIVEGALDALARLLPTYRGVDGDHEGICFLCGYETNALTVFTTAIAPRADHARGYVHCAPSDMAEVTARARSHGLGVLCQVHSHPSSQTGHSWGDDEMIFLPFEGMLSIVVPWYAHFGLRPLDSLGVHQFQDGVWVLCERHTIKEQFRLISSSEDIR